MRTSKKNSKYLLVHTWRVQRKQVLVSFNNQVIWTLLPIFNEKAGLFLRNIGRHIGKGEFDVVGYSANCTFDVLGGICFPYVTYN